MLSVEGCSAGFFKSLNPSWRLLYRNYLNLFFKMYLIFLQLLVTRNLGLEMGQKTLGRDSYVKSGFYFIINMMMCILVLGLNRLFSYRNSENQCRYLPTRRWIRNNFSTCFVTVCHLNWLCIVVSDDARFSVYFRKENFAFWKWNLRVFLFTSCFFEDSSNRARSLSLKEDQSKQARARHMTGKYPVPLLK